MSCLPEEDITQRTRPNAISDSQRLAVGLNQLRWCAEVAFVTLEWAQESSRSNDPLAFPAIREVGAVILGAGAAENGVIFQIFSIDWAK
jgi:hypothetical protein